MVKTTTTISIWRDALGYTYSDDDVEVSLLPMMYSFGLMIARLAETMEFSENADEIVRYDITITKNLYKG